MLEELTTLPTDSPVLIHQEDAAGHVVSLAVRVTGEFPSRRLRALYEISLAQQGLEYAHPCFFACDLGGTVWITTASGNAGRLTDTPDGMTLDDGFGRTVQTFPAAQDVDAVIERAARALHAEITEEPACRHCGCTASWGCGEGCAWATPDCCTACAGPLAP
ncbi:hypothetical protein [Deinococcus aluminii]